jgi:hypothetical protein
MTNRITNNLIKQYQNAYNDETIAILLNDDNDNSDENDYENCTIDDIINNTNKINKYSNTIDYLLIPNSYYNDNSNQTTAATTMKNKNNNVEKSCQKFSGSIIVDDNNVTTGIENDMKRYMERFGGHPRLTNDTSTSNNWSFTMMLMTDYDCDGDITWDDYISYHNMYYSNDDYGGSYSNNNGNNGPPFIFLILPFFIFFIGFACVMYKQHEFRTLQRQQQHATTSLRPPPPTESEFSTIPTYTYQNGSIQEQHHHMFHPYVIPNTNGDNNNNNNYQVDTLVNSCDNTNNTVSGNCW